MDRQQSLAIDFPEYPLGEERRSFETVYAVVEFANRGPRQCAAANTSWTYP